MRPEVALNNHRWPVEGVGQWSDPTNALTNL